MNPRPLLIAASLFAAACSSTPSEEELRLIFFKRNSKEFFDGQKFEMAQTQCRKGLSIDPDDVSLQLLLGFALIRQKSPIETWEARLVEAAQTFEGAIGDEDEFDYRSRLGLGEAEAQLVNLRTSQLEAAKSDERLTPEERAARLEKIQHDVDVRLARAEEALGEVLATPVGKDNALAMSTLARIYACTKRYPEAEDLLRRLAATLSRSIHLRSQQLDQKNQPAEMRLAERENIDRLTEQRLEALALLTNVLAKQELWNEVIAVYAQIEAEHGMQPADYYNRAEANSQIGSADAAIADYDQFIQQVAARGLAINDMVKNAMERKAHLLAANPKPVKQP